MIDHVQLLYDLKCGDKSQADYTVLHVPYKPSQIKAETFLFRIEEAESQKLLTKLLTDFSNSVLGVGSLR